MNKTELIEYVAENACLSKAISARALDAMLQGITETLKKGNAVTLVGFGTFSIGERAARTGRNPRTGESIQIEAAKLPKFKPGKQLKDALGN